MIIGKHLIAGEWVGNGPTFRSEPYRGIGREYTLGTSIDVDNAVQQAAAAFEYYANTSPDKRSQLLNAIAAQLERLQQQIISICCEETGLVEDRIAGEFTRTVNQLRYFASIVLKEDYLDRRHDTALPDRQPIPRPDLRMLQRPIGPVVVFGASNFPLAFSTAGGDTAAALAAGCPVIVKGHAAHPGTADCVAQCIHTALQQSGLHTGVFSQIQSNTFDVGQSLVQHPLIKAVGFTGSLGGGRALYNLCASRPEPIPFYGELGSINPVFILPGVLQTDTQRLAKEWIASLTVGAGQLCTNPGLIVLAASDASKQFLQYAKDELRNTGEQVLLSESIASSYREGHQRIQDCPDTSTIVRADCRRRSVTSAIFSTRARDWLQHEYLSEEVFGPLGQVVLADSIDEMITLAKSLDGQLTCTIHMQDSDAALGKRLLSIVEHKAGRIIANGFPTGVEVSDAMVHGGPYPASTNFGATSVGSLSMRRFLRPVCYQNLPASLVSSMAR